MVKSTKKLH